MVGECEDERAPVPDSMAVSDGGFGVVLSDIGVCRENRKDKTLSRLLRLIGELRDTSMLFSVSLLCCHFITGRRQMDPKPFSSPPSTCYDFHSLAFFPIQSTLSSLPSVPSPFLRWQKTLLFPLLSNRQEPLGSGGRRSWTWVGALWLWTRARLL